MSTRYRLAMLSILFCIFTSSLSGSGKEALQARLNAEAASEAFSRSNKAMHAWLRRIDPVTGLLPRTGMDSNWVIKDTAADLYPFMILAAFFTERDLFDSVMHRILRQETIQSNRIGQLPDDLLPGGQGFAYAEVDLERILFGSSEYAKDGLLPVVELLGQTPWYYRLRVIASEIIRHAPYQGTHGKLPAESAEVNGNMLQILTRLCWKTSDEEYLDQALAIADTYFLDILPNTDYLPPDFWDFRHSSARESSFRFSDHGNEIVGGLAEFYAFLVNQRPEKAKQYSKTFIQMIDRVLEVGRNPDGIWFTRVDLSGNILDRRHVHCWGYLYAAIYTAYLATGKEAYREAVQHAIEKVTENPDYLFDDAGAGRRWGANAYSDSIEGALNLLSRLPNNKFARAIDEATRKMFDRQRDDGIVEDWYGDGNFIRTSLMYSFWKTQGSFPVPWIPSFKWGATREEDGLRIYLSSSEPWKGKLCFDHARHRNHWNMKKNYSRLNEFPEWYVVDPSQVYTVQISSTASRHYLGSELLSGLPLTLSAGEVLDLKVKVRQRAQQR